MRPDLNSGDAECHKGGADILFEIGFTSLYLSSWQVDDASKGRQRKEGIDPSRGVDDTGSEVTQIACQKVALQRYRRIVGAAVHQIADK